MEDYMQRMVAEGDELTEKLAKLNAFLLGPVFPTLSDHEQGLMNAQVGAMTAYLAVLTLRTVAAKNKSGEPAEA